MLSNLTKGISDLVGRLAPYIRAFSQRTSLRRAIKPEFLLLRTSIQPDLLASAIENLRNDCASYSRLLLFYLALAGFVVFSASQMSDKSILFGELLNFPILDVDVPVDLILTFFPALQVFLFIALARSTQRIDEVAKQLAEEALGKAAGEASRTSEIKLVDFAMSMPSLLMPPSAYLQKRLDCFFSKLILHAGIVGVFVTTSTKLSAFGDATSQAVLLALVVVYLAAAWWLFLSNPRRKRFEGAAFVSMASAIVVLVVPYGLSHASFRGSLDRIAQANTLMASLNDRLVRHADLSSEVIVFPERDHSALGDVQLARCANAIIPDDYEPVGRHKFERLHGSDFSDSYIAGLTFAGTDLSSADFSGATLVGVEFRGAILNGANFSGACLTDVDFKAETNLRGANFSGANIAQSRFDRSDLSGAFFQGAALDGVRFANVDAERVSFENAIWFDVDLRFSKTISANLDKVLLIDSRLETVELTSSNWSHARLIDVTLQNVELSGSEWLNTVMQSVRLSGGSMSRINMRAVSARDVRLQPHSFEEGCIDVRLANGLWIEFEEDVRGGLGLRPVPVGLNGERTFFESDWDGQFPKLARTFGPTDRFRALLSSSHEPQRENVLLSAGFRRRIDNEAFRIEAGGSRCQR